MEPVGRARRDARDALADKAREAGARASDPYWRGSGGNVQRYVERAFDRAVALVRAREPEPGESGARYLMRIAAEVRAGRDDGPDSDDEAWFASATDEAAAIVGEHARIAGEPPRSVDAVRRARGATVMVCRGDLIVQRDDGELACFEADGRVGALAVSPDARFAIVITSRPHREEQLEHVDLATGAVRALDLLYSHKLALLASLDEVLVVGDNTAVVQRHAWTGEERRGLYIDHEHDRVDYFGVEHAAVAHDGSLFVATDTGEENDSGLSEVRLSAPATQVYDLRDGRRLARTQAIDGPFLISGDLLVTRDAAYRLPELVRADVSVPPWRSAVELPGTSRIVVHDGERVYMYDLAAAREVRELARLTGSVGFSLDPDGCELLVLGDGAPQRFAL